MNAKTLINVALVFTSLALTSAVVAQSKAIAVVDTNEFIQPQRGITRLLRAMESVEREFAPQRAEISLMHELAAKEIEGYSFTGPIPTDPRPMTRERREKLKDKVTSVRNLIEKREAEMERSYIRRSQQVTDPILKEIRRSLKSFAQSRGITVLFNASPSACLIGCAERLAGAINITRGFIAEYNRLNP
jgi:Skp family chaperone for outer membrane proteins